MRELASNYDGELTAQALEDYRKVNPNDLLTLFTLGEHYYRHLSNLEASRNCFEALLAINQSAAGEEGFREHANYYLGYIAYRTNRLADAIKHFENVININNQNARAQYMLMLLYYDACRFADAEKYAGFYLESAANDSAAFSIIGRVRYITGQSEYMAYLRKGTQPQRISDSRTQQILENFISQGLLMAIRGEPEAEIFLNELIKAKQNDISLRIALSRILDRNGNKQAAALELATAGMIAFDSRNYTLANRFFREAIVMDDSTPEIYYYIGAAFEEQGMIASALYFYKKINAIKPTEEMTIHIGYLYLLRKRYDRALTYFTSVIADNPNSSKPHFMMGILHYEKKQYKTAERHLLKAIELNSESEIYYLYLARVREKDNNIKGMVAILETAFEVFPESPSVNNHLGYIYVDYSINIEKGYKLIQKALRADPTNVAYIDSLGWAYFRMGDYEKALEKLLEATKGSIKDPIIYDHLGDTYFKLGQKEQAVESWKKSLELEENSKIQKKIDEVQIEKDDKNDAK